VAVEVRLATRADREELVRLFHAIEVHYWGKAAPSRAAMVRHVDEAVLASGSCEIAIAERDGRAAGMATFAVLYPTPGLGGQLFMKDLFTLAESRGQGVGRALMGFLARLAVERGCVRFDWTAETDNPEALAFYDRLGAGRVAEKIYYRFDGERLRQLAARAGPAEDEASGADPTRPGR
jgi:ribosomal protein S18 acetylase RimI-like enzyme